MIPLIYSKSNFIITCPHCGGVQFEKTPATPIMKKAGNLVGTLPAEEAYECVECRTALFDPFKQLPTQEESDRVVDMLPFIFDDHFDEAKNGPLLIKIGLDNTISYVLKTTWEALREVQEIILKVLNPTAFR